MKLKGPMLRLRVGRAKLFAEAHGPRGEPWSREVAYGSAAELPELIGRLAEECGIRGSRIRVTLEHPPVQLRTIADLPPVRAAELTALVAHHVSRFFRTNGTPLVTDAAWIETNGIRLARAAAVEESLVESLMVGAHAAGLVLDTITVADAGASFVLLPGSERVTRARRARRRVRVVGATTAGIWALVGALFLFRLVWERRGIERELTRLEAPLAAVLAARREMRDVEAALGAIAHADRDRSRALALLAAVTAALPDSSVVTSLTWRKDGITMLSGAARKAAAVASRLDRAPGVGAPRFDGPVMREMVAGRQWERFTIVFGAEERSGKREGS